MWSGRYRCTYLNLIKANVIYYRLAWEFSVSGGIVTSWSIRAVRLLRYIDTFDFVVFGFEIVFIIFTLYYTIQEFIEVWKLGPIEYLCDPWSYLDVVILIVCFLS